MYPKSDIIGSFQFRLKAAEKELELFRSGEKYIRMKEQMQAEFRAYERIIANLKKELADAHIGTAKIRRIWMEALDECLKDCEKRIKACQADGIFVGMNRSRRFASFLNSPGVYSSLPIRLLSAIIVLRRVFRTNLVSPSASGLTL